MADVLPRMLTINGAEEVLVRFLFDLFRNYRLPTTREPFISEDQFEADSWADRKAPAVSRGFIPINVTGIIDPHLIPDYPRIVVQAKKSADVFGSANTESLVTINVLFGAYDQNPDRQGYRDVLNMFEHARIALWERQIIDHTIALREPFEFEVLTDYFPYYFGLLTSTWTLATPDFNLATIDATYD